jgi:hypothetical protein
METHFVLGIGPNPIRQSNKAIKSMIGHNKQDGTVGFREGSVSKVNILKELLVIDKNECVVGCARIMINGGQR